MSSQNDIESSAEIVDMVDLFRKAGRRKRVLTSEMRDGAILLSMRQNLMFQATVGIDDIERTLLDLPKGEVLNLNGRLRHLLNKEFGSLRVHKHRYAFTVGHQCFDTLVAGLLRVQYHAQQMETTQVASDIFDDSQGVLITWGVGNTVSEAETERSKRKALKRS
ncbi:MAG: hypothetical protein ACI8VW_002356 [bacterium]